MTGVKHTNKKCNHCEVDLVLGTNYEQHRLNKKDYICKDCYNKNILKKRMFVNGKYVSKTHPLHKAGRFKTFEGAAFAALEGYEKTTEGYVYIINNPCWDGWLKIGMAVDAEDRCNSYQTSSPHRDYRLLYARRFKDRRKAEKKTIHKLKKVVKEHNGEWFKTDRNTAQQIIEGLPVTL